MHLITLNLIPHKRYQRLCLIFRPLPYSGKQRERVALHSRLEELTREVGTDLLETFVFRPGAEWSGFFVGFDVFKTSGAC